MAVMARSYLLLFLVGLSLLTLACKRKEGSLLQGNEYTISNELRTLQVITTTDVLVEAQVYLRQDSNVFLYLDELDDLHNRLAYTEDDDIRDSLEKAIEEHNRLIDAYQKKDKWIIISYKDSISQELKQFIIDSTYHFVRPYVPRFPQ